MRCGKCGLEGHSAPTCYRELCIVTKEMVDDVIREFKLSKAKEGRNWLTDSDITYKQIRKPVTHSEGQAPVETPKPREDQ